jgi:hypothetical protein
MAADHSSIYAKCKNLSEHCFENSFREELPCAADGRVPREFLVYAIAQKVEDIQAHPAMFHKLAVAGDILQITNQTELEKYHGVDTLLAAVAIKVFGKYI